MQTNETIIFFRYEGSDAHKKVTILLKSYNFLPSKGKKSYFDHIILSVRCYRKNRDKEDLLALRFLFFFPNFWNSICLVYSEMWMHIHRSPLFQKRNLVYSNAHLYWHFCHNKVNSLIQTTSVPSCTFTRNRL